MADDTGGIDWSKVVPAPAPEPVDIAAKIRAEALAQNVDPDFAVKLGYQESRFHPEAKSPKGAYGPMQLMPDTAQKLGVDRYDLDQNIKGGVTYLKQQLDAFDGDKRKAAAAYNAGPAAVTKYGGVPPYKETQAYVDAILGPDKAAPSDAIDWAKVQPMAEAKADDAPIDWAKVQPMPSVLDRLGAAAQKAIAAGTAGFAPARDPASLPGQLDALNATFPKGGNSPLQQALEARLAGAEQQMGEGRRELFGLPAPAEPIVPTADEAAVLGKVKAAGPGSLSPAEFSTFQGWVNRSAPQTPDRNAAYAPSLGDLASDVGKRGLGAVKFGTGAFGALLAYPSAIVDVNQGKALSDLTQGFGHGKTSGPVAWAQQFLGLPQEYDARMPQTALADALANTLPALHTPEAAAPEAALKQGSGAVVDAHTNEPLTTGQEAFYKDFVAQHPDKPVPPAQRQPGDTPAPGEWYVDLTGKLLQVPTEGNMKGEAHPTEAAPEPAPEPAPAPAPPAPAPAPEPAAVAPEAGAAPGPFEARPGQRPATVQVGQRPLKFHGAQTVYREATPWEALSYLPGRVSAARTGPTFVADVPELATGQDDNRGALVQFEAPDVKAYLHTQKPGSEAAYLGGAGEYIVPEAEHLQGKASAIRFPREIYDTLPKPERAQLDRLEAEGWTKTETGDHVQFVRPSPDEDALFKSDPEAVAVRAKAEAAKPVDMMDTALDALRDEKSEKPMNGPRLSDFLIKQGGLKDLGDEIGDIRGYGARGGRLVNKSGGIGLDEARERAQEAGYIGKPDLEQAATHDELIQALHRDLSGDAVHSRLHEPRADAGLRAVMADLKEEMALHDIDITKSNAEIRRALNEAWLEREHNAWEWERQQGDQAPQGDDEAVKAFGDHSVFGIRDKLDRGEAEGGQLGLPGIEEKNRTAEAIAQELQRRARKGGSGQDAGPLFDETTRKQGGLFDMRDQVPREGADLAHDPARMARLQLADAGFTPADIHDATYEASGVQPLRDKPSAPPVARANPKVAQPLAKGKGSVQDLVADLARDMDVTHRQGRMTRASGATKGQYGRLSGIARTRHWGEMDYASHEFGHALEGRSASQHPELHKAFMAAKAELEPLDYVAPDVNGKYRDVAHNEGFAEFFRRYVTGRANAERAAPKFFKAFEAAMAKDDPKMLKAIQRTSDAYQGRMAAPSADRFIAAVHPSVQPHSMLGRFIAQAKKVGAGEAMKANAVKVYGDYVGDEAEFARGQRSLQRIHWENTGKALDLEGKDNPLLVFRTMRTAAADGFANLWHGARRLGEEKASGPSLRAALEKAYGKDWGEKKRAAFRGYLIARRVSDEWRRYAAGKLANPPFHESRASALQAMADLEAQYPTFREASEMFSDYAKAELGLDLEAGLITQEAHDALIAERPFYAPMNRVREIGQRSAGEAEGQTGEHAGGYDKAQGSYRDFVDPVEVMMRRAMTQAMLRRFNMGVRAMYQLAKDAGPGGGEWIERVPDKEIKAYSVSMDEVLQKTAQKYGVDAEDLRDLWQAADVDIHPDDKLTYFRAQGTKARGEPMVFGWENGERFALRLHDGAGGAMMLEFMSGMSKELQHAITQTAGKVTGLLRGGVTTAPAWAFSNAIKDALDVWFKVPGAWPGVTLLSGLKDVVLNTDVAKSYERFGRIKGGVAADAFEHARYKLDPKGLKKSGVLLRHFASPSAIARLVEFSELGTRVGVYKLERARALKRGQDPESAAISASNVAADYMPFDRAGRKTQGIRKWVAFANAWAQGLDTAARTAVPGEALFKLKNGEALTRADKEALYKSGRYWALMIGMPTALSMWQESAYADDPEFQEINPYTRASNWVVKAEDLGVPKAWEHWTGKWVKFPKPFEHVAVADVVEREYEAAHGNERARASIPSELWTVLGPPNNVAFLAPYLQQERNRDFNGKPIIPEHLMGAGDPELKVNSYTSDLSKALSHEVGKLSEALTGTKRTFSPAMADHWITSLGGTWGRDTLAESNRVGAISRGEPQPALGPEDEVGTSRFVFNPARSSQSGTDFWDKLGKDNGTYTAAVNDFNTLEREHPEQAIATLAKLPDDVHDFVLAKKFGQEIAPKVPGGASALHPMVQAQNMTVVISDIAKAIRTGAVATSDHVIPLTPDQRKDASDVLTHLDMAIQHNALIEAGAKGYANVKPMDEEADRAKLAAIDPDLLKRLDEEAQVRKIPTREQVTEYWPQLREALRAIAQEQMGEAVQHAVTRGKRGKYDELIRQNQAVLAHP